MNYLTKKLEIRHSPVADLIMFDENLCNCSEFIVDFKNRVLFKQIFSGTIRMERHFSVR